MHALSSLEELNLSGTRVATVGGAIDAGNCDVCRGDARKVILDQIRGTLCADQALAYAVAYHQWKEFTQDLRQKPKRGLTEH